jgi:hypothetical protein
VVTGVDFEYALPWGIMRTIDGKTLIWGSVGGGQGCIWSIDTNKIVTTNDVPGVATISSVSPDGRLFCGWRDADGFWGRVDRPEEVFEVPHLPTYRSMSPHSINNDCRIVGWDSLPGFCYTQDGGTVRLPTQGGIGAASGDMQVDNLIIGSMYNLQFYRVPAIWEDLVGPPKMLPSIHKVCYPMTCAQVGPNLVIGGSDGGYSCYWVVSNYVRGATIDPTKVTQTFVVESAGVTNVGWIVSVTPSGLFSTRLYGSLGAVKVGSIFGGPLIPADTIVGYPGAAEHCYIIQESNKLYGVVAAPWLFEPMRYFVADIVRPKPAPVFCFDPTALQVVNGELVLKVDGVSAGDRIQVLGSTDLTTWKVIGTYSVTGPSILVRVPIDPACAGCAFRVRKL